MSRVMSFEKELSDLRAENEKLKFECDATKILSKVSDQLRQESGADALIIMLKQELPDEKDDDLTIFQKVAKIANLRHWAEAALKEAQAQEAVAAKALLEMVNKEHLEACEPGQACSQFCEEMKDIARKANASPRAKDLLAVAEAAMEENRIEYGPKLKAALAAYEAAGKENP